MLKSIKTKQLKIITLFNNYLLNAHLVPGIMLGGKKTMGTHYSHISCSNVSYSCKDHVSLNSQVIFEKKKKLTEDLVSLKCIYKILTKQI